MISEKIPAPMPKPSEKSGRHDHTAQEKKKKKKKWSKKEGSEEKGRNEARKRMKMRVRGKDPALKTPLPLCLLQRKPRNPKRALCSDAHSASRSRASSAIIYGSFGPLGGHPDAKLVKALTPL